MHLAPWQTSFPLWGICKPGRRGSPEEWMGHPGGKKWHSSGRGSLGSRRQKELPNEEKGHSPGRVVPREQKELPNMRRGALREVKFPLGDMSPREGWSYSQGCDYIPPENDVPRDWMEHCKEKRMGFPGQYGSNEWGQGGHWPQGGACFPRFDIEVVRRWQGARGNFKKRVGLGVLSWAVGVARSGDRGCSVNQVGVVDPG